MADIQWPTSLPQNPNDDSFGEELGENTVRTQMEVGPPKVRRRHTAAVDSMPVSFDMTDSQLATLKTFFRTTTKDGSLVFDFTHPITAATEEWRFLTAPKIRYIGPDWHEVSFALEKLP